MNKIGFKPDAFVGTKGVIIYDGKVLLLKRPSDSKESPGKWSLPGGRLEKGEQPLEGFVREVKEETGIDMEGVELLDVVTFERDQGYSLIIFYQGEVESEEVVLDSENEEWIWASVNDLPDFDVGEVVKNMIKRVLIN